MSAWQILAGAAVGAGCGVAAMVAAPVLAPVGVLTLAGAGIGVAAGGALGAAGGKAAADAANAAEREAYNCGKAEEKARQEAKFNGLLGKLDRLKQQHQDIQAFEKRMVALFAVGFSAAACDGAVSREEQELIESFVGGAAFKWQSTSLRAKVAKLAKAPPSFGDAMVLLDEVADPSLDELIDDLLELTIMADGAEAAAETAFRAAWRRHKARRRGRGVA